MGEMTLKEALDEYKNVYMAYRNFAPRTRVEYQNDLEGFIEFLGRSGIGRVKEIGVPIVERYVAHLEQNGFASLTRKRKVVTIRSFLSFLFQDGYIDNNIAKKIVLPFAESTTPNILSSTECRQLREACADNPRDRAIVELLLQTGIKLSELTRLTIDDVEFEKVGEKESGFVRIGGGRGKKDRLVPLNGYACLVIKSYLFTKNIAENSTLFLNRFDEPFGKEEYRKCSGSTCRESELGEQISIH
jgi:site-specific recombinase XerD